MDAETRREFEKLKLDNKFYGAAPFWQVGIIFVILGGVFIDLNHVGFGWVVVLMGVLLASVFMVNSGMIISKKKKLKKEEEREKLVKEISNELKRK